MDAVRQYSFGGPEVLRVETCPDPEPGPGQVRIAVGAAGVHLVDTLLRAGRGEGPFARVALPMTPGREVAGVIDALGPDVDEGWLGARVVAHLGMASGGYASAALAPVGSLHRLPDHVDAPAAVAMMGTGRMTMGLLTVAPPREGRVVLVTSAAGGIGTLLLQAARAAGAVTVGAAGGARKVGQVQADLAVDYSVPGWADEVRAGLGERRVDLVFDGVGGEPGRSAFDLLGPGGEIVLHGYSAGSVTAFTSADLVARGLTATVALGPKIMSLPGGMRALEEQAQAALAAGTLVPAVQTFPLGDAAEAHRALENRETSGKVVLLP
ncbi:MAG: zinc-binding dehydrogenase [Pseudonocardia sp.]|nr:zinc-binding dehydrogenase [Pseudonocardia sp.]